MCRQCEFNTKVRIANTTRTLLIYVTPKRQKPNKANDALAGTSSNVPSAPAIPDQAQRAQTEKSGKITLLLLSAPSAMRPEPNLCLQGTELADPAPYDNICINRPFFDVDGENWRQWKEGKGERLDKEEMAEKLLIPIFNKEEEAGIWRAPAAKHPDHKWIIMSSAFLKYDLLCCKAKRLSRTSFLISTKRVAKKAKIGLMICGLLLARWACGSTRL
ncbi:predicted protein [Plenodomus lingam JN3]|uniref:Predicted protein n=1 Tax=Leptosphaeria maculans (strain JN3 / isolate v23.1.3 / race Av1-4-5-6-7-8) TaxID=985895 RepID=E4ZPE9_LEPMJ|nr:predicted protein [Plenodomus lingam JN3]CBX93174.1 predicted protein [Plenodomus lingam JN3]